VRVAASASQQKSSGVYEKLKGLEVYRSSDGALVDLPSLWGPQDKAVVAFGRSFGCPCCWELAIQLRRDIKPTLDAQGVKLFFVSIGPWERSKDFVSVTEFPAENLLADPESKTYEALGLVKGVGQTFFNPQSALAFMRRFKDGTIKDLQNILPRWIPWVPPKQDQALQQGGMFVFEGERCVWCQYDQATGAHADLQVVLGEVGRLLAAGGQGAGPDCGCEAPTTA